jgi:hypothetical protein
MARRQHNPNRYRNASLAGALVGITAGLVLADTGHTGKVSPALAVIALTATGMVVTPLLLGANTTELKQALFLPA